MTVSSMLSSTNLILTIVPITRCITIQVDSMVAHRGSGIFVAEVMSAGRACQHPTSVIAYCLHNMDPSPCTIISTLPLDSHINPKLAKTALLYILSCVIKTGTSCCSQPIQRPQSKSLELIAKSFNAKVNLLLARRLQELIRAEYCHGVNNSLLLPTVTSFIPGLQTGERFRVSIHSWHTPEPSTHLQRYSQHPESAIWEACVFIDGRLIM